MIRGGFIGMLVAVVIVELIVALCNVHEQGEALLIGIAFGCPCTFVGVMLGEERWGR